MTCMIPVMDDVGERKQIRIFVFPAAKDAVSAYSEKEGLSEIAIVSRLIEGWAGAPDVLQDWLLGKVRPSLKADALKQIVAHFKRELELATGESDEPWIDPNPTLPSQSQERERTAKAPASKPGARGR